MHQVTDEFIAYTLARSVPSWSSRRPPRSWSSPRRCSISTWARRRRRGRWTTMRTWRCWRSARSACSPWAAAVSAFKHVAQMFAELEAAALRSYPARGVAGGPIRGPAAGGDAGRRRRAICPDRRDCIHPAASSDGSDRHLHELMVWRPNRPNSYCRCWKRAASVNGRRSRSWSPTVRRRLQFVGRFLALLELYRSRAVAFDQS